MVAVVVWVSRVGGSPIIAALRIPPGRGVVCAATDGAHSTMRNTIIRAVRAIESPLMKVVDIRAYPLKTRTALVRVVTDDRVEGIGACWASNVRGRGPF